MSNKVNLEYSGLRKNRKAVLLWRRLEDIRLLRDRHSYIRPQLVWEQMGVFDNLHHSPDNIWLSSMRRSFATKPIFLSLDPGPLIDKSYSWPLTVTVAPRSGLGFDVEPGQEDSPLAFIDHIHDKINKAIGVPYRWPNVDFDRPIIRPRMEPFFDEKLIVNDCHLSHDNHPVSDFFKGWMDAVKAADVSPKLIQSIAKQEEMKTKPMRLSNNQCEPDMSIYIFEVGDIRIAGLSLQRATGMRKKKHAHRSVVVRRILSTRKIEKVHPLGPPTSEQSDGKLTYNFSFNKSDYLRPNVPVGNT